ncbi:MULTISPECIES: hypothetical protein [Ancylobacter]|uniref:Uncharacterized protein n=1 Tax=Ancylobacter defluvii TaxID=1282440 RepID=A0A9W6N981_9HYPH|nr:MULTISPECIES: hypothetical protein [Ancylobacter]MDR6952103.1 hypothetical protein [Ancylobacter sp. 3268]GLK82121.1 hypothetical protein GCM10017653_01900 [Ancylobacter defluvii]
MFASVFPVLPALILAHAWMTFMVAQTLSAEAELATLPPEAYPI